MTLTDSPIPLIGFCAWSGTGKTTLLQSLLPLLRAEGLRIATVKHAHHTFEMDTPGKDSYELRKAGAECCVVVSRQRVAMIEELPEQPDEPQLNDALRVIDPDRFDLVLVEGFKHEPYPKIELHRPSLGKPLIHADDNSIIAIASDRPVNTLRPIAQLDLNDHNAIRDFLLRGMPSGWRNLAAPEDHSFHRTA